tara:strand:+ start:8609 stop:8815 length:207 start_codon:yes stop_codon:yes gene_type:complete
MNKWEWWQICFMMVVGTICLTAFMWFSANNPSTDDVVRGIFGWLTTASVAGGAGAALHRYMGNKNNNT